MPTSLETQGMAQRMKEVSSDSHSKETKHKVGPEIHNTKPNQPSTQTHDGGPRHSHQHHRRAAAAEQEDNRPDSICLILKEKHLQHHHDL